MTSSSLWAAISRYLSFPSPLQMHYVSFLLQVSLLMRKGVDLDTVEDRAVVHDFAHHHNLLFHMVLSAMFSVTAMGTRWRQEELMAPLAAIYGIIMQVGTDADY